MMITMIHKQFKYKKNQILLKNLLKYLLNNNNRLTCKIYKKKVNKKFVLEYLLFNFDFQ